MINTKISTSDMVTSNELIAMMDAIIDTEPSEFFKNVRGCVMDQDDEKGIIRFDAGRLYRTSEQNENRYHLCEASVKVYEIDPSIHYGYLEIIEPVER